MTTATLHPSQYTTGADLQKAVGQQYHLGLSDGSVYYGYLLEPSAGKDGGFKQRSDTASKDALINYSSGQLIDRDLAYFPRVTDGDFSGGGYQEVFLDSHRYFDSDLDPRVPGFLQLGSAWSRITKANIVSGANFQVAAWNQDFWYTFGESSGNIYSATGGTTTSPSANAIAGLDADGIYLFAATSLSGFFLTSDGVTWTTISTLSQAAVTGVWVVNQGTNGWFLYYSVYTGANLGQLWKIDLSQGFPIAVGSHVQVPIGLTTAKIIDVVPYQSGIAILTSESLGIGFDVWYSDGANATRIVRINGYLAQGMCQALGNLYISAYAIGKTRSPILAKIESGTYSIVIRPGSPFLTNAQSCLQPRSSGQFVYWPLIKQSISSVSGAKGVILQHDPLTGATQHLSNLDTTDLTSTGGTLRTLAFSGEDCAIVYANGSSGILQYQQTYSAGSTLKLVGSLGAVSVGAAHAAVTPAWGAGANRTAGNLLLCWVAGADGGAQGFPIPLPATPAGWTAVQAIRDASSYASGGLFYRIATGADAAPTIAAGDIVTVWSARLGEFSGNAASPLDQTQTASGSPPASPLLLVNPAADASAGDLIVYVSSLAYSPSATQTFSDLFNNGASVISSTSAAVNTANHYDFGYGIVATTIDSPVADAHSFTFTSTNLQGGVSILASFKRNLPAVTFTYATSGWLVSSHIDFATPGITKRFRRIEVHHAPLNAGESILIEAFVDRDPLAFTTALAPVPSTATATNSTVGSISTVMTFGQDTIGKTIYFALKLTAGTSNATTPRVSYVSIEVGGTWTWDLALACTSKRRLLDGQNEETMPPGKDLAYLLLLAYENGTNLTLYHRNGQSYTVAIESLELWNPSPLQPSQSQLIRDEEYVARAVLRQVA